MSLEQSSSIARLGSQASSRLPKAALLIWLMCWSAAFQHRWSLKWKILNQGIEKSYIKGIKYGSPPIISNPWICLFPCYLCILKRQVQNHKQDISTRQSNKNHQKSLHSELDLDATHWWRWTGKTGRDIVSTSWCKQEYTVYTGIQFEKIIQKSKYVHLLLVLFLQITTTSFLYSSCMYRPWRAPSKACLEWADYQRVSHQFQELQISSLSGPLCSLSAQADWHGRDLKEAIFQKVQIPCSDWVFWHVVFFGWCVFKMVESNFWWHGSCFFVERTPSLDPKRRSSYYVFQSNQGLEKCVIRSKISSLIKWLFHENLKQVLNSIIKGVCFTCLVKGTRCPKASRNCSMAPLWFVPQYDLIRRLIFFLTGTISVRRCLL